MTDEILDLDAVIVRDPAGSTEDATTGRWFVAGVLVCHTLELAWDENRPGGSCVPEGDYLLLPDETGRFRNWRLHSPGLRIDGEANAKPFAKLDRWAIEVHGADGMPAERASDGCPIIGMSSELRGGTSAVLDRGAEAVLALRSALQRGKTAPPTVRLQITRLLIP